VAIRAVAPFFLWLGENAAPYDASLSCGGSSLFTAIAIRRRATRRLATLVVSIVLIDLSAFFVFSQVLKRGESCSTRTMGGADGARAVFLFSCEFNNNANARRIEMAFSVPIITGTGDVCPDCGREIELSVVNTTARDGFFVTAFCFCGQRGRVSQIGRASCRERV